LGAEKSVKWRYFSSSLRAVNVLKKKGVKIFSIEQSVSSEDIGKLNKAKCGDMALVFGNEVNGISPKILAVSDKIFEIPMLGEKESLNVSVAFGVAAYEVSRR